MDAMTEFEQHRHRLTRIAAGMLNSQADAEDAVQQTWLRFDRHSTENIEHPGSWLTTVVARVCLDIIRTRARRREDTIDWSAVDMAAGIEFDPQERALLADDVGIALQVVLDTLNPHERVALVLHDVFDVPFPQIAAILDQSPAAARKLASRARQRVRGRHRNERDTPAAAHPVVEAFLAAARGNDLPALVAILHPDVALTAHGGRSAGGTRRMTGRDVVSGQLAVFHRMATTATSARTVVRQAPALINYIDGKLISLMRFTVRDSLIVAIEVTSDPEHLTSGRSTASDARH